MSTLGRNEVIANLSIGSLILYEDISGIVHYYYITNITKDNNDQIVCYLEEIPTSS
jgi:hypothetical protein